MFLYLFLHLLSFAYLRSEAMSVIEPHNDFRYVSEAEINRAMTNDRGPTTHPTPAPPRGLGTMSLKSANELAYRCAGFASKLWAMEPDPMKWKPHIEAAPEEMRELVRIYCVQKYREFQDKARRVAARESPAAVEAMAKMKAIAEGL
jgi:hypothetical protein